MRDLPLIDDAFETTEVEAKRTWETRFPGPSFWRSTAVPSSCVIFAMMPHPVWGSTDGEAVDLGLLHPNSGMLDGAEFSLSAVFGLSSPKGYG